jgi:hypothetical protein
MQAKFVMVVRRACIVASGDRYGRGQGKRPLRKNWERRKSDCSGFLKAVAADLGITLIGQANSLIDSMASVPWLPLESDAANAVR